MSETLVLLGIVIAACSGVPGLLFHRSSMIGQWVTTALAVLGAAFGLGGVGVFWAMADSQPIAWPWLIPGAEFSVAMDGLSAIFLMPIFLISLLGSIYGLGYWRQTEHPENGRKLRLFYGLMTAGMALLVIARDGILFLFGWEIMALSAYFLVATEDHDAEVRATGWIYLVATHVATLLLFALFALLRSVNGSFALVPMTADLSPGMATAILVLALGGFGIKAGIMPLHIWLPSAHAIAPSHVSAMMSGVLIKMGVYGLVRVTSLAPAPPLAWGGIVLGLGIISGVLGVAYAIGQHDLKRLLAYHSIENIGIIVMGLGLALLGRTLGQADLVILGLAGCLLHVWNHALFKALLFLSAGSVIHASRSREIDHLGGLAKSMPWTALGFLVGAVAICGLPPLNGFVSEFLIYLGLFGALKDTAGPSFAGVAFAPAALALIGTLATACFVKVYGAVFLGVPRSGRAEHAHESPPSMLGPMGVLAGICFFIGIVPRLLVPILGQAIAAWAPHLPDAPHRLDRLAGPPLSWVTIMSLLLLGTACLRRPFVVPATAKHGHNGSHLGMRLRQADGTDAVHLVVVRANAGRPVRLALRPRTQRPAELPLFPAASDFHSDVPDAVLDEAVLPTFRYSAWLFTRFRVLQQGSTQIYLLYIFVTLIALLLWR